MVWCLTKLHFVFVKNDSRSTNALMISREDMAFFRYSLNKITCFCCPRLSNDNCRFEDVGIC